MKWLISELNCRLEREKELLRKYKILGVKVYINASQKCVDDLAKAISILKAENNSKG